MKPSPRSLALALVVAALVAAPALLAGAARASDAVTVPDVGGQVWQDAVAALQGVGLVAHSAGDGLVDPQTSMVVDQCPRAGDTVPPGSTVTLTVKSTISSCATVGYGGGTSGGGGGTIDPVAFWRLDEAAGPTAHDATGTNHDGQYVGTPAFSAEGAPTAGGDTAVAFSGSERVDVPYSADLNPQTYTVEAWVKPTGLPRYLSLGLDAKSIVCSRSPDGTRGYILYLDDYVGHPQFAFQVGAGTSRRYVYDGSGAAVQANRWYHVAGSFDGTNLHLYVDGVEVTGPQRNDGSGSVVQPNPDKPAHIGMCTRLDVMRYGFLGTIDEVGVWNGALPAATIADHAQNGAPVPGGGDGGCQTSGCPLELKPPVPLVFLPGISGSQLTSCVGGIHVWPDAITDPDLIPYLAIDPDRNCLDPTDVIRDDFVDVYNKTIDALTRLGGYHEGTTLFVCPFDWRQSASFNFDVVYHGCIQHALAAGHAAEVDVLAHSQGGLVASELVRHTQGAVRRVVTLGTPVLGAEKALDLLEWAHECMVGPSLLGGCVMSLDVGAVQKVLGTMPGYFELLPSPTYAAAVAPPLVLSGKSPTAYSTLEDFVAQRYDRGMVGDAVAVHLGELDDFTPTVPMLRIVGNNKSTLYQVKVVKQEFCRSPYGGQCFSFTHTDFLSSKLGDGTVPLNSADLKNDRTGFDRRNGVPNRYFSHSHMGLAQSDDSIQAAVSFFRAPAAHPLRMVRRLGSAATLEPVVLPPDMPGSATPTPTTPSVQIEVFGFASTTVESLAAGSLGDGAAGLDGGSYGHAEGTESFTLDTPGSYTATVRPTDTYPLLVLVRRYADTVEGESLFYVPAPVAGEPLTLALTSDQALGTLRLDDGGVSLAPVATTGGDVVDDATPPTTVGGGSVSAGGSTVTLLAQDDAGGAGVAATYAEPDGATPFAYTQPFDVPLYSTVRFWSLDKAGNGEDVRTIVADDVPGVRQLADPVVPGDDVERTVWPAGDEDWFRFAADGSSTYRALLHGLTSDYDLELYDADGALLQAPHTRSSASEQVRGVLPAGTYYLRVVGHDGAADRAHPYKLKLQTPGG